MDSTQRLEKAKTRFGAVNCYSFALYMAEMIDREKPLSDKEAEAYLSQMKSAREPEKGCVLAMRNARKTLEHMCYVSSSQPFLTLIDRPGTGFRVRDPFDLSGFVEIAKTRGYKIDYYKK